MEKNHLMHILKCAWCLVWLKFAGDSWINISVNYTKEESRCTGSWFILPDQCKAVIKIVYECESIATLIQIVTWNFGF